MQKILKGFSALSYQRRFGGNFENMELLEVRKKLKIYEIEIGPILRNGEYIFMNEAILRAQLDKISENSQFYSNASASIFFSPNICFVAKSLEITFYYC